ncbi:MAG: hypothetical protein DRQ04_07470 [Candidatus Hydrothermota bacterium]|nr:MAG: hypothetical protein DRQ04_07470 [Candidatus Hydrothermae bacterium]
MRKEGKILLILLCLFLITLSKPGLLLEKERAYQLKTRLLPRVDMIELLADGYKEAVADYFWMRVTLYYGDENWRKRADDEDWGYLLKLTDLVARLNPYFFMPYYFAGVVFPWESNYKKEVIPILERGMKYLPDEWRIPFLIGFIYFYFLDSKKRAAYYIQLASEKKDSPEYLIKLAARLYYEAGEEESALLFLEQMERSTSEPELKKEIKRRIKVLKDILFLKGAVQKYIETTGKEPEDLEDLVRTGIIKEVPREPYGGRYYYDRKDKRVKTSSELGKRRKEK